MDELSAAVGSQVSRFLRVPPFPAAKTAVFLTAGTPGPVITGPELSQLVRKLAELRVGGTYWGAQPELPDTPYTLVHSRSPSVERETVAQDRSGMPAVSTRNLSGDCDPWHLVSGAVRAVVDADDHLALVAALAGIPLKVVGDGAFKNLDSGGHSALCEIFRSLASQQFLNPFGNEELDFSEIIELCGFWRRLIDSNRDITGALGFAFWKRGTVAPLLWDGSRKVPFVSQRHSFASSDRVAVWKSRTSRQALARLETSGAETVEVEDGFIRSAGLGADCVPPLSIVVDRLGVYFDPAHPSELEQLLQQGGFSADVVQRARQLRELIVELGISKYGAGDVPLERRNARRHLLVVGQVEDDRAVTAGLGPRTNLELLRNAREANLDTYIIYKPHPDVEAGHRAGAILDSDCLALADEIVRNGPISSLIQLVDEIHVNTSLAGFEAVLRGKTVFTYGVPFYAGWGLTRDFGPVPCRRNATRSIDELVAAALLLYPRYVDPVTGLPCPPEILVRRIAEGNSSASPTPLVRLRRLQGRWKRTLAALRPGRK